MRIKEFAEKYGVDKRDVDFWTNYGLLTPKDSNDGPKRRPYRDYDEHCEGEMEILLMLRATGLSLKEIAEWRKNIIYEYNFKMLSSDKNRFKMMILKEKSKAIKTYDDALAYLEIL